MKYLIFLIFLSSMHAFGQLSTSILDQNNVSAMINNGGTFFNDELNGTHGYEVPKGSGAHAFYSAAFWFGGVDQDSMLHLSGSRFVSGADIFPGPIATAGMYTSVDYTSVAVASVVAAVVAACYPSSAVVGGRSSSALLAYLLEILLLASVVLAQPSLFVHRCFLE